MKRAALALALVSVVVLSGCTQQLRDLEGVPLNDPDKIEMYANVDQHPNIVALCINGAGFATTTRDYSALTRVEAWDGTWCAE